MIAFLSRFLLIGLLPVALTACVNPAPASAERDATVPLGSDLGPSGPVAANAPAPAPAHATLSESHASSPQDAAEMQMAHAGHNDAHGTGTINSVDPTQHKVNLSHNPIPEIGWPAMTMDFPVAPSIDLRTLKSGTRVNFTIEQGQGGMYEIQTISPAGGGR
jgi:Cu(I)/Ag(I) efflux system periplasmic protein CusF